MWKCARRSLKSSLTNGIFRCNTVLSTKARKKEPVETNCLLKLAPAVVERCNQFCNLCKNRSGNFSREQKDGEEPKEKNWFFGVLHSELFCFLKWSGLITLGYGFLQYELKSYSNVENESYSAYNKIAYHKTFGYLINAFGLKPYNCVLPKVEATKSKKGKQQFTEFASTNFKPDVIDFSGLEKGYQKVLGVLNNSLGTHYMKSGQCKDALEYFIQSAKTEYAPGIFNLGICYEKGLGTNKNFEKAAELYQKAADLGHPTAMYNLGIFYAQGKGGIEVDINHARDLFKAAAKLGQIDAIKALELEKNCREEMTELISDGKQKKNNLSHFFYDELMNQSSSSSLEHFSISDEEIKSHCDSYEYSKEEELNSSLNSDSGVLDLSRHTEPSVVLL